MHLLLDLVPVVLEPHMRFYFEGSAVVIDGLLVKLLPRRRQDVHVTPGLILGGERGRISAFGAHELAGAYVLYQQFEG